MSWGDGSEVPTSGENLVVVGIDNNGLLHVRIFDSVGNRFTDVDETRLPDTQAEAISTLKQQLPGLLPPHFLTGAEKERIVDDVTSMVGQILPISQVTRCHNEVIAELRRKKGPSGDAFYCDEWRNLLAVPYIGNVGMMVYRKDILGKRKPPQTWEDLRKICNELREQGHPYKFLIETQTYDTLMATARRAVVVQRRLLAHARGPGGSDGGGPRGLPLRRVRATHRIPRALDPRGPHHPRAVERGPGQECGMDSDGAPDWIFARHWFSTWVDVMTRRDKDGVLLSGLERTSVSGSLPSRPSRRRLQEFEAPRTSPPLGLGGMVPGHPEGVRERGDGRRPDQ